MGRHKDHETKARIQPGTWKEATDQNQGERRENSVLPERRIINVGRV